MSWGPETRHCRGRTSKQNNNLKFSSFTFLKWEMFQMASHLVEIPHFYVMKCLVVDLVAVGDTHTQDLLPHVNALGLQIQGGHSSVTLAEMRLKIKAMFSERKKPKLLVAKMMSSLFKKASGHHFPRKLIFQGHNDVPKIDAWNTEAFQK